MIPTRDAITSKIDFQEARGGMGISPVVEKTPPGLFQGFDSKLRPQARPFLLPSCTITQKGAQRGYEGTSEAKLEPTVKIEGKDATKRNSQPRASLE